MTDSQKTDDLDTPSISSGEAARRIGISMGTLRRWVDSGFLPCYRTQGRQRRFSERQIQEFLDKMRQG